MVPQVPQFVALLEETHFPSQMRPLSQTQLPPVQRFPSAQAVAQAPQCAESLLRSAQVSPQTVKPKAEQPQAPFTQASAVGHACPQAPQLLAFFERSTQLPPHAVKPAPQVQAPAAQIWSAAQACPQLPQLRGSDF